MVDNAGCEAGFRKDVEALPSSRSAFVVITGSTLEFTSSSVAAQGKANDLRFGEHHMVYILQCNRRKTVNYFPLLTIGERDGVASDLILA